MPTRTVKSSLYPRHSEPRLLEALADSPVVLIHGPRQCGKTTLVRTVDERRAPGRPANASPEVWCCMTTSCARASATVYMPYQCGNFGRERQLQDRALREQLGLEPEPVPVGRRVQGAA